MKVGTPLQKGDLVQLIPVCVGNPMFGACIMVITEPKPWGAQGYVQMTGKNGKIGGQAYYRAKWEEMETTGGQVAWVQTDEFGEDTP